MGMPTLLPNINDFWTIFLHSFITPYRKLGLTLLSFPSNFIFLFILFLLDDKPLNPSNSWFYLFFCHIWAQLIPSFSLILKLTDLYQKTLLECSIFSKNKFVILFEVTDLLRGRLLSTYLVNLGVILFNVYFGALAKRLHPFFLPGKLTFGISFGLFLF